MERHYGTIKTYKSQEDKKYGFIKSGDKEYFFHKSGLENRNDESKLMAGVEVGFDLIEAPKGAKAINISILEELF